MAFQKGEGRGRNGGGRKPGTPNKVTKETRELIAQFVAEKWDDFLLSYDAITDPEKKCSIMTQLLPFIAPKMASVEYKDKTQPKTYRDELDELTGEKTRE